MRLSRNTEFFSSRSGGLPIVSSHSASIGATVSQIHGELAEPPAPSRFHVKTFDGFFEEIPFAFANLFAFSLVKVGSTVDGHACAPEMNVPVWLSYFIYAAGWFAVVSLAYGIVEVDYRVNDLVRLRIESSPFWAVLFVVMRSSEVAWRISLFIIYATFLHPLGPVSSHVGFLFFLVPLVLLWIMYTLVLLFCEPKHAPRDAIVALLLVGFSMMFVNPVRFVTKVGYNRVVAGINVGLCVFRFVEVIIVGCIVFITWNQERTCGATGSIGPYVLEHQKFVFYQCAGCNIVFCVTSLIGRTKRLELPEDAVLELVPRFNSRVAKVMAGAPRGLSSYLLNAGAGLTHRMFARAEEKLSDFVIERVLGRGAYGVVVLVRQRIRGGRVLDPAAQCEYAMKLQNTVNRGPCKVIPSKIILAERERDVLRKVSHPFIIRLVHYFDVPDRTWVDAETGKIIKDDHGRDRFHKAIVMEFCPDGDLEKHILRNGLVSKHSPASSTSCVFSSLESHSPSNDLFTSHLRTVCEPLPWLIRMRRFLAETAVALQFLHARNITHRDLKPPNTLLKSWSDGKYHICLSDFGCSKEVTGQDQLESLAGTHMYAAPEIAAIQKSGKTALYSSAVDNFSYGRMALVMLWRTKFVSDDEELVLPDKKEYLDDQRVPPAAVDFVQTLTQRDPKMRGAMSALTIHPFFDEFQCLGGFVEAIDWNSLLQGSPGKH